MTARREAQRGVLGQQPLVRGEITEVQVFVGVVQGQFELTPATAVRAARST